MTLTVACVLRSSARYNAEWVEKLQHGVARHLSVDHDFVCLSDVAVPCKRIPLISRLPGWWSKIELFRPGLFDGPVLYLDLDTVVVGQLDAIAAYKHSFTMAHEYYRPAFNCSTAMAWHGDFSVIWHALEADASNIIHRYDRERADRRIGDQAFIEDVLKTNGHRIETFRDLFGERSIASWKVHVRGKGLDGSEAVVAFHGSQKPDTLRSQQLIKDNWI